MVMLFGIDRLLAEPDLRKPLDGRRVALLAHPASLTRDLTHSLDALVAAGVNVTALFGPQHGVRGDLQDNMMESPDFTDPVYHVPVFSLYGEVRRPTDASMDSFDVMLVDLQDVGCRIYTFVTTLLYVLEAAARHGKSVWVLDRPNPAGRTFEEGAAGAALPSMNVAGGTIGIVDALVGLGLCASKGEARRLIKGGGARVDGEKVEDETLVVTVAAPVRVSAGRKHHGLLNPEG